MRKAKLSLSPVKSQFSFDESNITNLSSKGMDYIISGIRDKMSLTEYDIEMMIYRTEEIIENELKIKPIHGEITLNDFYLMDDLREAYFNGALLITSDAIEKSFNIVAEAVSYGAMWINNKQLYLLTGLVFLREACHHLDITAIHFMSHDGQNMTNV
ncbi:hypothetical protein N3553_22100 [Pantoea dispersa]|uniref:hypothetical protein n=1 Tax=Pantoea dispersa TaxID=59814 RepID=UPI0021AE8727|nr:hypothetical protein [Pantoea dispersa]MCT6592569.1 hypothetical protein [Pantoea dispersa]